MSIARDFHSNLYTRRSTKTEKECLDYLSRLQIPRLSKTDRDSCEGMLTKKECWEALNAMKNGKSSGNDGLTKEFYVCFFNEISDSLVAALNRSFEVSQLFSSQRQAVIVLIEKKEKDKRLIKNWRPISLINVDSTIASKALASRMKTVLSNIIKCDQTAYVKGRYIGKSIRLVTDILEYTAEHEEVGILFSADFGKGLDSIEHTFIFATLEPFGFGPQFSQWVRTFLKNAESCVMNNGHSMGYFSLKRGTRQGDPLSAYLFILCMETLFIQIRENPDIKGIHIGTEEIKLSAYADNADFLTPDVKSLELIFRTCETFQSFSSLKLNLNKSEACWIGAINCKWININCNTIRSLGIFNSYDTDLEEKLNFLDNLKNIKEILNIWKHRGLSLAGRILIFKSLTLSKVLYASTMKCPSKQVVDQLNVMQRGFIWNNKKPKIKHSTLVAGYSEGGYKDTDIRTKLTALKVAWVTKLLDDNFSSLEIIPTILFTTFGGINKVFITILKLQNSAGQKLIGSLNPIKNLFSCGQR